MGAWGAGSFENDAALDFASEVEGLDDVRGAFAIESYETKIDVDMACRIIVAAECVAAMRGHASEDMPGDLAKRVHKLGKPSMELFERARDHVSAVMSRSELSELWAEAEPDDKAAYNIAMTDLMERLGRPQKKAGKPGKRKTFFNNSPCSFCGEAMGEVEASMFDITVAADDISSMKMGGWAHIKCLNSALHPQHMIQNWELDDELLEFVMQRIEREREEREKNA
ncbi:hypothetical protein BPTFM16_02335 [Altererythrobacter insulae]|nr:hypothetical protein BPTFM16_02335 [Altererythrobacter insulae]